MDLPVREISSHFDRTAELIAPLSPSLVLLRQSDVSAALRRTCERRHPWFEAFLVEQFAATPRGRRIGRTPFDAVVAYFIERQEITDSLVKRWPGPKLVHDNTDGDWERQRLAVAEFLALPETRHTPISREVPELTGVYRAETGDEWRIAADAQGLYLADGARPRLLPHGRDAFVIVGLCVEVEFERVGGVSQAIRCRGALPGLAERWSKVLTDRS
jgi:hypothetical protein